MTENGLTNDKLKIIAVISMLVDHIGSYLLPNVTVLRFIGRISFPIFAFMIAEGCRYTKNKKRYLLNMATLAIVCQILFRPFSSLLYLRIPCTFTLSVIMVFLIQYCVNVFKEDNSALQKGFAVAILAVMVVLVYWLSSVCKIDYGFYGCMTPVLISAVTINNNNNSREILYQQLTVLAFMLLLISSQYVPMQYYSLASLPLLAFYNGKRENIVPKNFFYIFYPLHLAVIFAIKHFI